MPVTQSAKKAHRQSLTKRSRNRHFSALYREVFKKFEKALATNVAEAGKLLSEVYSAIDTLVKKNIMHANTAARRKSAVAKLLAKTGVAPVSEKAPAKAKAEAKKPAAKKAAPKAEVATEEKPKKAPAKKPAAKKAPAKKA